MPTQDPIWSIMEQQGRRLVWLAKTTGYSYALVLAVKAGRRVASAEFRGACVKALALPESVLFRGEQAA